MNKLRQQEALQELTIVHESNTHSNRNLSGLNAKPLGGAARRITMASAPKMLNLKSRLF